MSSCCQVPPADPREVRSCPVSGTKGKPVDTQTIKALLTEVALRRVNVVAGHRFRPDPECDVVYFDSAGERYTTADVRVRV